MTRRTFVAFVLLVALAVNTACATRYGPRRPVLEPARQAEIVRRQAEALEPGTSVVVTFADGNMLHGILQDVSAQSLAIRADARAAVPGRAFQLRDIAWIEKQRIGERKKTLVWVGIGIGALVGLGIAAIAGSGV